QRRSFQYAANSLIFVAILSAFGRKASSWILLNGVAGDSGPARRITGASSESNASSAIIAQISAPAPNSRLSSYTTKHFPVLRASLWIVSASIGRRLRTSLLFAYES